MADEITLSDIFQDLQAIDPVISSYEQKYQLLSPYFYRLYQAGKLEERWDFIDWAALWEIKLDREQEFENHLSEALKNFPIVKTAKANEIIAAA
ncbi:MAG: hypothetical protein ACT6FF_07820 [Methanosarcinaceae archaeon]